MDRHCRPRLSSLLPNPSLRHRQIPRIRSLLLDARHSRFQQRNADGARYLSHRHRLHDHATLIRSQADQSGPKRQIIKITV